MRGKCHSNTEPMKHYTALFLLVFLIACNAKTVKNKSNDLIEVEFSVMYTSDYCGGAYPPAEVLKSLDIERPLKDTELIMKSRETETIYRVTCDENGKASLSLPAGDYLVFFPIKMTAEPAANALSKEQCQQWKKTPDTAFKITEESKEIELKLRRTCNPCEAPKA